MYIYHLSACPFGGQGSMNVTIPVGESFTFTYTPSNNGVIQAIAIANMILCYNRYMYKYIYIYI